MKIIFEFEKNHNNIIVKFLIKLLEKSNKKQREEISNLLSEVENKHRLILNNFSNLTWSSFDLKIHLNILVNFINSLDKINLDYTKDEIDWIIKSIRKDYELYWKNIKY